MIYVAGRLAEDGQTMDFPVIEKGAARPFVRAGYHVLNGPRDYGTSVNLEYFAVPEGTTLSFGERKLNIPFIVDDHVQDVRRFRFSPFSVTTAGLTLAKIHPGTPLKIEGPAGAVYHSFEMLETPEKYKNPDEPAFDFTYIDENKGTAIIERGSRVIRLPGAVLFPDYCASRLPGWLAREFNGSPEFGFGYSEFREPRRAEVMHTHRQIMEPYMGVGGVVKLFVAAVAENPGKGELIEIRKGDVVIPLTGVPRRIVFDGAVFPSVLYTINYAPGGLDSVPAKEREVLDEQPARM